MSALLSKINFKEVANMIVKYSTSVFFIIYDF